ncbi:MAG: hypothetical protein GC149_18195 [Gammaproteobacteria bacterium]|nr:hypothetical protein [Gammaproteobacteria bacterium]
MLALLFSFSGITLADDAKQSAPIPAQLAKMSPENRQMIMSWTPELRQKFLALSPELRATISKVHAGHTRHGKELTLRQVMQEILSEYQSIAAAVATDNAEQAADSARRLANHRIPVGGLLPYFPLDKINNDALSVLPGMNDAVEGSALRLAEAAERGNMAKAAVHLGDIASGCVACHQMFRGRPGVSAQLLPTARSKH